MWTSSYEPERRAATLCGGDLVWWCHGWRLKWGCCWWKGGGEKEEDGQPGGHGVCVRVLRETVEGGSERKRVARLSFLLMAVLRLEV